MHRLSHADCEQLLALTGELYLVEHASSLPPRLLRGLQQLIPHAFGGCHLLHPTRREICACYEPVRAPVPTQHRDFWRLRESHPLHSLLHTHPIRAWKITDAMTHRNFLASEFYNALYRPLCVDQELAAVVPEEHDPGAFLLVSLHRNRSDFSERDRTVLNLLLPHLARVRRRLTDHSRGEDHGRALWGGESAFGEWLNGHTPWRLTRREGQVLYWLCQGKTNGEIGSILGIAERTAETHALRLYPKMGVENRYTAIATLNRMLATDSPQNLRSVANGAAGNGEVNEARRAGGSPAFLRSLASVP